MEATVMKAIGVIGTSALFLLLGATVPAFAQEEHSGEAKPAQHEEKAKPAQEQEAKPVREEKQAEPAKREEMAKPAKEEKEAKPAKQEEQAKTEKQDENKSAKQEQQAKAQNEQRTNQKEEQAKASKQENQQNAKREQQQQTHADNRGTQQHAQRTAAEEKRQRAMPALRLSARGEGRIPDARFQANFGRGHEFRIGSPRLVDGYSRFQYGGYWFGFVQPWPVAWYYTDNVYVDYIDGGYYLCNPYYPDDRVAISVVL
jgi:outer membrane biosynthesis protein TonB